MTFALNDKYATAVQVRQAARSGQFSRDTAGQAPDQVQANLIVLPQKYAADFRLLCARNPVSCCLLGESTAPGEVGFDTNLAADIDVRTDAPGYNVYNNGKIIAHDVLDIKEHWTEDSVAFLIGCSFTFEDALHKAGLVPRHALLNKNVPMYKTSYKLLPAGVFEGNMVVSMRPYPEALIEQVREVTRPYIRTHGEPVAWGWEGMKALGIKDINNVDFGDAPDFEEGEVPVFWGCGVTPQLSVMESPKVKGWVLGHAPGKMICLDLPVKDIV